MFRTQEHVPEIYVNKSRDFQLLCRAYDIIFGGMKYNIDSLHHSSNTVEMNNVLLPLLKSKLGFFSTDSLPEEQLRILLAAFPTIVRDKGSKSSIIEAVNAWFKINQMVGELVNVDIDPEAFKITLYIDSKSIDTRLLDEIFAYILPTGYEIEYKFASGLTLATDIEFAQDLKIVTISNKLNSRIRRADEYLTKDPSIRLINNVGLTQIARPGDELSGGEITIGENKYPDPFISNEGDLEEE